VTGEEEEQGNWCSAGAELQLGQLKDFWRLVYCPTTHTQVSDQDRKFYVMYILPQFKNLQIKLPSDTRGKVVCSEIKSNRNEK
jgi:hypothetical protein